MALLATSRSARLVGCSTRAVDESSFGQSADGKALSDDAASATRECAVAGECRVELGRGTSTAPQVAARTVEARLRHAYGRTRIATRISTLATAIASAAPRRKSR